MKSKETLRFSAIKSPAILKVLLSIILVILLVSHQFFLYPVFAEDYVISGNGDGSSNSISFQKEDSGTVEQSNDAEVNNDVNAESNTADNRVSDNTGEETKVETGDASSETKVENSGNTNATQLNCCLTEEESSIIVTDNGSVTDNSVKYTQTMSTGVVQDNNLKLNNNIQITANTGDNEASDSDGDVTITTGQVNILAQVLNHSLNSSSVSITKPNPLFNIKVSGNGSGSENYTDTEFLSNEEYLVNNYLELNNNLKNKVNTGGNKAKGNKGNVLITTGNVYLDIILSNKANFSKAIADCGCKSVAPSPTPTPGPLESPPPASPPSSGGGGSGGSGGGGSSGSGGSSDSSSGGASSGGGGQVLGVTLPGTGGFSLIQATLFTLLILVLGVTLRLEYEKIKKPVKEIKTKLAFSVLYNFSQNIGQFINWKLPFPIPRDLFAYFKSLPSC